MDEQTITEISQQKYDKTEKGKARYKRYHQTEKFKIAHKRAVVRHRQTKKYKITKKRYFKNNPKYKKATDAVGYAIRIGKLPRPDTLLCHYCPNPAQQYHHHKGYAPEHRLDVIPICKKCHRKIT